MTLNDPAAIVGTFSVGNVSVTEGDVNAQTAFFTVTRNNGSAAASVSYTVLPGDGFNGVAATAGVDYVETSGTVNFAAGQTTAVIPFQVLGDTNPEPNETLRVVLSSPTNGGTLGQSVGVATIIDNDAPAGSQFGTAGNDTLISNTPGAFLVGNGGNDTYLVNNAADTVIEQNGGGTDIVYTTVSYNLGSNEVEALSVANQMTTNAINLVGNYASQTIAGNYGDNLLNGGGGADTLIGLFGNDTYAVGDSRIIVQEQVGQGFDTLVTSVDYRLGAGVSIELFAAQDRGSPNGLRLTGNELAQTIAGTAGADTINGGGGMDTLIGGGGIDTFVISAVGQGNVAVLADFNPSGMAADRIGLTTTAFAAIGSSLDANEFVTGTAATTVDQHIIYNAATGQLFYDADGSGVGAAVLFAQVVPNTVITAATFDVVQPVATSA